MPKLRLLQSLRIVPVIAGAALAIAAGFLIPRAALAQAPPGPPAKVKPRVIATTDGEIDDRCSMVRFLLYANEWDVEGLIHSSSRFHWLGHTWSGVEWINAQLDQYARIYPHLRENADGYPTPDELHTKVYVGNIDNVGSMDKDSPGSDHIVQILLDDKPGKVYLQAWGGTNTIARALWKIQHEYPDQIEKVNQKAVVYIILDQDSTFRDYIEPNWPKLEIVGSFRQFGALAYAWSSLIPYPAKAMFERPWLEGNITVNHGALAAAYEPNNGAFRSEGDSPSFMYEIEVGLRSLENPSYGGWGGRFIQEKPGVTNVWKDGEDDGNLYKPLWRWAEAYQNDFAVRADWSIKSYREANHPPIPVLAGPQDVEVAPGSTVKLDLSNSGDPDSDRLNFKWWVYREPSTYKGPVDVTNPGSAVASATIPSGAKAGDTIHIIGEVTDSGKPALTRYVRVIATVK
jgi:hypothetical protein